MKVEKVNKLIDKYLNGLTTAEEEHKLAKELLQEDAPTAWKPIELMLGELALGEAIYDQTLAQHKRKAMLHMLNWSTAAVVALLLTCGVANRLNLSGKENLAIMYENGVKITDEKQVLAQSADAVSEIFSLSDTHNDLVELFNPE